MAILPQNQNTTVNKIYQWYESENGGGHRPHLGASEIGHYCERFLWYKFRHAFAVQFSGRLLRLFQRGHNEEHTFINEFKGIGIEVMHEDANGNQYSFEQEDNKHFKGSMDFALKGLSESPKTWHVGDAKTANDKKFKEFAKEGTEKTEYKYFAQLMVYMAWTGMKRAMIFISNKNDDSIYTERFKFSKKIADQLIEKAKRVVFSPAPLEKISERPDWYECKFCDAYDVCHGSKVPSVNCRTCCHSTPKKDGTWLCEKHDHTLSNTDQARACDQHLFIPDLVPATMKDGDTNAGWIKYEKQDGTTFVNSSIKHDDSYLSRELEANFAIAGKLEGANLIRSEFGAEVSG